MCVIASIGSGVYLTISAMTFLSVSKILFRVVTTSDKINICANANARTYTEHGTMLHEESLTISTSTVYVSDSIQLEKRVTNAMLNHLISSANITKQICS